MIREEMKQKGIHLTGQPVFEVEVVEYEPDGDSFACLDTIEVLHLGLDEMEARDLFQQAKKRVKRLNINRGGLQADDTFLGLRFNTYTDTGDGSYYPIDTEEDYGEYGEA